jgi:energy-coupling factor transporter ATP-binding protein EcfA2
VTTSSPSQPLSLRFRAELLQRLTATLGAGECCSLVGVAGVGKTNLARHLQRPEVQQLYWGDVRPWVLLIDSHALAEPDQPAACHVFELLLHRLISAAEEHGAPAATVVELDRLHSNLAANPDALLGFRYLERALRRLLIQEELQLILLFDQFDTLWQKLPPRLFLNLRYLRDEFKYRLVFLTFTRERLSLSRQSSLGDAAAVESFWEIFDPHVFGLGAYDETDANELIDRIARRHGRQADDAFRRAARAASGGHPALLRAITWAALRDGADSTALELQALPAARAECEKIWRDLPDEERRLVQRIARGSSQSNAALAELRLKGIAVGEPARLFSPLFADYARGAASEDSSGVVVDLRQRQVWVDGQQLQSALSPLEFKLLEQLARHVGEVCRRDELLRSLYPDEQADANDERIDTLLRRLREALGEDGRNPRHLLTHRGVGVRLAQGQLLE